MQQRKGVFVPGASERKRLNQGGWQHEASKGGRRKVPIKGGKFDNNGQTWTTVGDKFTKRRHLVTSMERREKG